MKRLLSLVLLLFVFSFYVSAQGFPEEAAGIDSPEETAGFAETGDSGFEKNDTDSLENTDDGYIEMDIKTSSLTELAAWCRELGLSEGGTREDLASRLRAYYNISPSAPSPSAQRTITIESAQTTEYFSIELVDEDYARLKGDVIISLKDGEAVHRIKAWEILYNRTRNVLSASGKVEYVKEEGDAIETFRGESITVNLDNWSSIFMDGVSEKSMSGSATAYRFAGTVISRNSEEVTVLSRADITNAQNDEAYWSLYASKVWLLPGNDFAFLNAVLKVGNIPVLYVPFFYYPADEIVFHPVLGFRTREGTFLQTTTYILGRPKTSVISENSITKIFGSASDNMEMKREGVFLRSTGAKMTDPGETRLSVLFDAYANLGAYLGTELVLPRRGPLGEFTVSAGLGLTRDIFPMGNGYTPFPRFDGESEWNRGMFFSFDAPFRYRFNITGSFQAGYGSFSWALPYYSDPYVDRDFMRRSEVLDWLSMLREGAASSGEEVDDTYLNSYEWRLSGSFKPPVSKLAPWISSLSISSISSSLLFSIRDSANYDNSLLYDPDILPNPLTPPNPGKAFFFPSRFTMYSVSASVAGTPFTLGSAVRNQAQNPERKEAPGDALLPDLPRSPWDAPGESAKSDNRTPEDVFRLAPPVLSQRFNLPSGSGPGFSFDYRLAPTTASELRFSSNWKEQEDIDWSQISTILSRFRGDGSLGFNLTGGGAYSSSLRFSGTGSWQDYMYLNKDAAEFTGSAPDASQRLIQAARNRAYNETYFTSSWDYSASVKPFFRSPIWGNSGFDYNVRGLLAKTNATVDPLNDDPRWDWVFGKWEKTDISAHQVSANIAANIMDYSQSLSLSTVLPPRDPLVSASAVFRAWISETSVRGQVTEPWDDDLRKFDPVYFTETLRFGTLGSFQQYVVFSPELEEYTTVTSSLSLSGFTASYSAVYAQPYRYNYNGSVDNTRPNGWLITGERALNPREFQLGYVKTFTKENLWAKRLSFSVNVNTGMAFDLQRYTNSRFNFSTSFNFAISNFLDFRFTAKSENAVVFRYFQNLPFFDLPTQLYPGQETNFFRDLVNSFRFDNEELRRQSGFKLKALDLSVIHHLGDWNARLSVNMTPTLDQSSFPYSYKFKNEVSFLVQWVPIGEIKTQIDYSAEKITVK